MKSPTPNLLRRGFTLVEVMIAIAIALLLIVAIGQIFGIAQRTSSAGTTLLGMNAIQRSFQTTLNQDFHDMVDDPTDSPGFVIASYPITAFYDKTDSDADTDQNAQTLNDPSRPGQSLSDKDPTAQPFSPNSRIHRLDRMGFFARNIFRRQTANTPNYLSPTTSSEAFIWYGHLTLPNNGAISSWDPTKPDAVPSQTPNAWFNPGASTPPPSQKGAVNDNNLYASQWILGRQVTLLLPNSTNPAPSEFGYTPDSGTYPLSLLSRVTMSSEGIPFYASRYDLAYAPIAVCRNAHAGLTAGGNTAWWENLIGLDLGTPVPTFPDPLINKTINIDQRFYANPYPTKPSTGQYVTEQPFRLAWHSAASAQTAPIFIRGCTQFIVEYAGDYVSQDQDPTSATFGRVQVSAGGTTAFAPDGAIDFIPVRDGAGNWTRQIRWYGYPRDVNGTDPNTGKVLLGQPDGKFDFNDVMPLSIFMANAVAQFGGGPIPKIAFERATMDTSVAGVGSQNPIPFRPEQPNQAASAQPYVCAWGPDLTSANIPAAVPPTVTAMPKMIRITIATGDANGRLNTDRYYEYVFTLP